MPFSNILKSAAGTCRYCGNKAGILNRDHPECRRTFDTGWTKMVELAADAARTHQFNEKNLRLTLAGIAARSHGDGTTVNLALEEGWTRGVVTPGPKASSQESKRRNSGISGANQQGV